MKKIFSTLFLSINIVLSAAAMVDEDEKKAEQPVSSRGPVCFVECDYISVPGGNVENPHQNILKFANLTGYRTESDAKNQVNGFFAGLLCECRLGSWCRRYGFVLPQLKGLSVWVNVGFVGQARAGSLYDIEAVCDEFNAMDGGQKLKYLDRLISNANLNIAKGCDDEIIFAEDEIMFRWIQDAAETLKTLAGAPFSNAHKVLFFLTMVQVEGLVTKYDITHKTDLI